MPSQDMSAARSRRAFLTGAAAALITVQASPGHALPFFRRRQAADTAAERSLFMLHQRTGEIYHEVYFNGEAYLKEPLDRFAVFARDMRSGTVGEMDPHLLDLAHDLQQLSGPDTPLILTHGFRAARRGGPAGSHHLTGEAMDITHPELGPSQLYQLADRLERGGLGRYRSFIHIDTGPTRRW